MLGCHDFCGYYDWTFHYLRHRVSLEAPHQLWAQAISQAQQHYTQAAKAQGLRGLYNTWIETGNAEQCDWTFTLDEEKNVLRWDMRQCPSKGHLIHNDLYADEDYCDHCMGWIQSVLHEVGGEVVAHEHNHCGQCWGEMRIKDKPSQSLAGAKSDITQDPAWQRGYIERWANDVKLPLLKEVSASSDPVDVLRQWFANDEPLTVLGRGPSARDDWTRKHITNAVIVADPTYATTDVYAGDPRGVLIGDDSSHLAQVAERFHATPKDRRPLLMHTYLPRAPMQPFADFNLPRPVPILPLLVRENRYVHEPFSAYPTTGVFALLLAAALHKKLVVAGIDLYQHPSGQTYTNDQPFDGLPPRHSQECDIHHLRLTIQHAKNRLRVHPFLKSILDAQPTNR